eukprot:CAMPEP_0119103512 /NCGR_PEP_ID=MMETSP1180-20130426/1947_1 /TAXON_ID=3052 ORGANISM="Chlamydomonas cf sp, Strain CCMP681" /NCGR_SAMPLE_ID=MMETSP1180 /ASSEMBLY_ACC=CAM_ASM_000741 /LENGTH=136 /DNA_ID=CAMNT_0007088045 /DNA_START=10 /DNA_END=420 /DNA_ORIENTATION=-
MASPMLATRPGPCLGARPAARQSPLAPRVVLARADPKVTRTYREDDGSMTQGSPTPASSEPQTGEPAMYADEATPQQQAAAAARKSNLSKDMKARLRKEYTGFGGSSEKAMGGNYFLYIILIVSALAVAAKLTNSI